MTTDDQIQDYVEYLVQCKDVRNLQDLLPSEREKLSLLILINNGIYVKFIKFMHKLIENEVKKNDSLNHRTNNNWR